MTNQNCPGLSIIRGHRGCSELSGLDNATIHKSNCSASKHLRHQLGIAKFQLLWPHVNSDIWFIFCVLATVRSSWKHSSTSQLEPSERILLRHRIPPPGPVAAHTLLLTVQHYTGNYTSNSIDTAQFNSLCEVVNRSPWFSPDLSLFHPCLAFHSLVAAHKLLLTVQHYTGNYTSNSIDTAQFNSLCEAVYRSPWFHVISLCFILAWLFIACSDERWLYYRFSVPHLYISLHKRLENVVFGRERVDHVFHMNLWPSLMRSNSVSLHICLFLWVDIENYRKSLSQRTGSHLSISIVCSSRLD